MAAAVAPIERRARPGGQRAGRRALGRPAERRQDDAVGRREGRVRREVPRALEARAERERAGRAREGRVAGLRHFLVEHDGPQDALASVTASFNYLSQLNI